MLLLLGLGQAALQPLSGAGPAPRLLGALAIAALGLVGYWALVRLVERRLVYELAPRPAVLELALGAGVGALLFTLTIGVIWVLGYYRVVGANAPSAALPVLSLAVVSGVVEELLIRGIVYRIAQEGLGTWLALALSAALFGALHLANPNATLVAGLAIAIEAGLLLGAAYQATGRLWMPIGLHFAWNFTQGGIFGVAISGNEVVGLLRGELSGPPLLTGGAFGAEASVFAVVICTLAAFAFVWHAYRRGRIVAPAWRRRPQPAAH
jgi:membrane protease YdiL (CAAX protease family)